MSPTRRRTFLCMFVGLFLVGDTLLTGHRRTSDWKNEIYLHQEVSTTVATASSKEEPQYHHPEFVDTISPRQPRSLQTDTKLTSSTAIHAKKESSTNKTLVIVMGDLRCGEPCWKSLKNNLLDVNMADLALLIQPPQPQYQNASLFDMAKYHWPVPHYSDWMDAMDLVMGNSSDWQQPFFEKILPIFHQNSIILGPLEYRREQQQSASTSNTTSTLHKFKGSAMIIFFYRYLLSQKIQQLGLLKEYDWFIVTRTDHFYKCPHESVSSMDPNILYIPKGEDWRGLCDRHLVVSKHHILSALDILPPLLKDPQRFQPVLSNPQGNSEMFLKARFMEMQLPVRRFGRSMFIGAVEHDSSLWVKATQWVEEGIMAKYPSEYKRSSGYCAWQEKEQRIAMESVA